MYLPRKGEIFTFPKNLCQLQLWHFVWYNAEHSVLRRSEIRWLRYSLLGISLPYLSKYINPEHTFYIICVFRIFVKKESPVHLQLLQNVIFLKKQQIKNFNFGGN